MGVCGCPERIRNQSNPNPKNEFCRSGFYVALLFDSRLLVRGFLQGGQSRHFEGAVAFRPQFLHGDKGTLSHHAPDVGHLSPNRSR